MENYNTINLQINFLNSSLSVCIYKRNSITRIASILKLENWSTNKIDEKILILVFLIPFDELAILIYFE